MSDTSSNRFWESALNYQSFESRAHRFRMELLPAFYSWLGITPDSNILDGGCGTGVLTRYLAGGLKNGHITGFDINKTFIAYGRSKIKELSLSDKVTLEVADGFDLPYEDGLFDAVTNYTYIGCLSDREAGMKELIRACKRGGVVSCIVATNSFGNPGWPGDYPFDESGEYRRLAQLENRIFTGLQKAKEKGENSELMVMGKLGLKDIHLYPFAHLICYNDTNYPLAYRKQLALDDAEEEINWLKSRYSGKEDLYAENGFSQSDFEKLLSLLEVKRQYLCDHFEMDDSYEWYGGFNYIITGRK